MSQMSFSDFEYAGKRKQTRRERFLAEMDQVVSWTGLFAGKKACRCAKAPLSTQPLFMPQARPRTKTASEIPRCIRPRKVISISLVRSKQLMGMGELCS